MWQFVINVVWVQFGLVVSSHMMSQPSLVEEIPWEVIQQGMVQLCKTGVCLLPRPFYQTGSPSVMLLPAPSSRHVDN